MLNPVPLVGGDGSDLEMDSPSFEVELALNLQGKGEDNGIM
jgi:hypothetical protein